MEIEGRIIQDLGIVSGTSKAGNPWMKGEWVLETLGTYPKKVKFHIFGEERLKTILPQIMPGATIEDVNSKKVSLVGRDVNLSFDLESREFNGRWYTDVSVYAARPAGQQVAASAGGESNFGGGFGPAPQAPFGVPEGYPAPPAGQGFAPQPAAPDPGFGAAGSSDDLPF